MKTFRADAYTDNGIFIFKDAGKSGTEEHIHNFVEIVYILSGNASERIMDREYCVSRGDMLFILPGETHSFAPRDERFSYYNIILTPELLRDSICRGAGGQDGGLRLPDAVVHFLRERDSMEEILENMLSECELKDSGYFNVLFGYANILLTKVQRRALPGHDRREDEWSRVTGYIDENLGERLTAAGVAARFYYNPSYFSRVFSQKTGVSFSEYLTDRRLRQAARLLAETDLPVERIAGLCGFSEKSTFYRNFARKYSTSPASYRKG